MGEISSEVDNLVDEFYRVARPARTQSSNIFNMFIGAYVKTIILNYLEGRWGKEKFLEQMIDNVTLPNLKILELCEKVEALKTRLEIK